MSDSPHNDRFTVIYYGQDGDEARRILAEAIENDPDRVYMLVPGKEVQRVY